MGGGGEGGGGGEVGQQTYCGADYDVYQHDDKNTPVEFCRRKIAQTTAVNMRVLFFCYALRVASLLAEHLAARTPCRVSPFEDRKNNLVNVPSTVVALRRFETRSERVSMR